MNLLNLKKIVRLRRVVWQTALYGGAMLISIGRCLQASELNLPRIEGANPRNVIFILTDDHRYDAIGALGHPFLKTPNLDSMLAKGVHFKNALVNTSLCSPSRASILTGLYTHNHEVVDNNNPVKEGTRFFAEYLQAAGYETAMIGKWHMGRGDAAPRPGFDHWISFAGQGTYYPRKKIPFNINGKEVPQKGYITDELTDYALEWLDGRSLEKPFMLYLSHKAVHGPFQPAKRHEQAYEDAVYKLPDTFANTPENYDNKPRWLQNQRNSWHGVDYPYHKMDWDVTSIYKRYNESLLGVDDSVGRVMGWLEKKGILNDTIVIYMGDNGFIFGEHGLIDKRVAYEASMRVPMIMQCPNLFKAGTVISQMVANIDIAPTILEAAGLTPPAYMDGKSFLSLAQEKPVTWRDSFLYEYYWEWNYPQTPTIFALRTDRYKYIYYYGLWDLDEMYDIQEDPLEKHNLVNVKGHQKTLQKMRKELFSKIKKTGGSYIPLKEVKGPQNILRYSKGSGDAKFPNEWIQDKNHKWGSQPPMRDPVEKEKTF